MTPRHELYRCASIAAPRDEAFDQEQAEVQARQPVFSDN